jgi:hypothetical protein
MDKLFIFLRATKQYKTYENRCWGKYEPFSYCYYPPDLPLSLDTVSKGKQLIRIVSAYDLPENGKIVAGETTVYSMPLIVPPVRNKQFTKYGKIFADLWGRAEIAISECSYLYLIGYSFPDTDIESRNMFRRALERNNNIDKIIVLNPNPQRIEEVLTGCFNISSSKIEIRPERFADSLKGSILDGHA